MYSQIQLQLQRGTRCGEKRFDSSNVLRAVAKSGLTNGWTYVMLEFSGRGLTIQPAYGFLRWGVVCQRNSYPMATSSRKMKSIKVDTSWFRRVEDVKLRWSDAAGSADRGWVGGFFKVLEIADIIQSHIHYPERFFFRQHSQSHPHYRYSGCDLLSKAPFYYPPDSPTTPRHQFFLAILPVVLYVF